MFQNSVWSIVLFIDRAHRHALVRHASIPVPDRPEAIPGSSNGTGRPVGSVRASLHGPGRAPRARFGALVLPAEGGQPAGVRGSGACHGTSAGRYRLLDWPSTVQGCVLHPCGTKSAVQAALKRYHHMRSDVQRVPTHAHADPPADQGERRPHAGSAMHALPGAAQQVAPARHGQMHGMDKCMGARGVEPLWQQMLPGSRLHPGGTGQASAPPGRLDQISSQH